MLSINKQNFCSLTVQMGWTQRVAVRQLHRMTIRKWVFYLDSSLFIWGESYPRQHGNTKLAILGGQNLHLV